MKRKINYFVVLIVMVSICLLPSSVKAVYSDSQVGTYETELAKFPADYKAKIIELRKIYPNAVFVAQDKFYIYKSSPTVEAKVIWTNMLNAEINTSTRRNKTLIQETSNFKVPGYKSVEPWSYNYITNKFTSYGGTGWDAASNQTVAYYLDPRNFLNRDSVFMFESLYYHDYQTKVGVDNILSTTSWTGICPGSNGLTYSQVITKAAAENNISAYFLASRIRLENYLSLFPLVSGKISGYEGFYNFFNIGATGTTNPEIISNGIKRAKSEGWSNQYLSIMGGAKFVGDNYVKLYSDKEVKGQLTNYLQKWDPFGPAYGGHQYQQNIMAPINETNITYSGYKAEFPGFETATKNESNFIFYIPVYQNMPTLTTLPNPGNPNNYLKSITIDGDSGKISNFIGSTDSYKIYVPLTKSSIELDADTVGAYSTVSGTGTIPLDSNDKTVSLVVTAQNGAKKTYTVRIIKSNTAVLSPGEIVAGSGLITDGTYLSGISIGLTADKIKSQLYSSSNSQASIKVTNISGIEKTTTTIATGDKVTIINGSSTKTYVLIILGDLNGNGEVNSGDLFLMQRHILEQLLLKNEFKEAANMAKDSNIDSGDIFQLQKYLIAKNK